MTELRGWDGLLGINARNTVISRENPREAIRLVNDKYATKKALAEHGIPTSPTILFARSRRETTGIDWAAMPDEWALKPNHGLGGNGIMLAAGRTGRTWAGPSGKPITVPMVKNHLRQILDGEFSGRLRDEALFEPLIHTHPGMARLAHQGLPDIRIICLRDEPVLAMLRLPTKDSGGRANLHQRAIGAAVDLRTGVITQARVGDQAITAHPDTGTTLIGEKVPYWIQILGAAGRCADATGLRYLGVDIVIDATQGPLVLEVNARPGLQIQNITGRGLQAATRQ
jgi:alpha-L-glutamate ligase-like protein